MASSSAMDSELERIGEKIKAVVARHRLENAESRPTA
jgi:hypothetical protein